MVKDYDVRMPIKRTINQLLHHARALDTIATTFPLTIRIAAAARAGQLFGIAYHLIYDLMPTIPAESMYDLMKRHRTLPAMKMRPSARRGRW